MPCWNALSTAQQDRLIVVGVLPIGYQPEGDVCDKGAEMTIECENDEAPGPRFYCLPCGLEYLARRAHGLVMIGLQDE
jgi:hypothetical protein